MENLDHRTLPKLFAALYPHTAPLKLKIQLRNWLPWVNSRIMLRCNIDSFARFSSLFPCFSPLDLRRSCLWSSSSVWVLMCLMVCFILSTWIFILHRIFFMFAISLKAMLVWPTIRRFGHVSLNSFKRCVTPTCKGNGTSSQGGDLFAPKLYETTKCGRGSKFNQDVAAETISIVKPLPG